MKNFMYIDDLCVILGNESMGDEVLNERKNFVYGIFHMTGIRLNSKTDPKPATSFQFIGWTLNTSLSLIRPRTKFYIKLSELVEKIFFSESVSIKELESFTGHLNYIGSAFVNFRIVSAIFNKKISLWNKGSINKGTFNETEKKIIEEIISMMVQSYLGISFMERSENGTFVVSDTSSDCAGGYIYKKGEILLGEKKKVPENLKHLSSTGKELWGAVNYINRNMEKIKEIFEGNCLAILVDNQATTRKGNVLGTKDDGLCLELTQMVRKLLEKDIHFKFFWSRRCNEAIKISDSISKSVNTTKNLLGWKSEFVKKVYENFPGREFEQKIESEKLWGRKFYDIKDRVDSEISNTEMLYLLPHSTKECKEFVYYLKSRKAKGLVVGPNFETQTWFTEISKQNSEILFFRWCNALKKCPREYHKYGGFVTYVDFSC